MLFLLFARSSQAADIEGVKLADRVRLSETGPELVLNGAGVRTRLVFKVYVSALFLTQKRNTSAGVLSTLRRNEWPCTGCLMSVPGSFLPPWARARRTAM